MQGISTILILTFPTDVHACAVEWVLTEVHKKKVTSVFLPDYPEKLALTITVTNGEDDIQHRWGSDAISPAVIWRRRLGTSTPSVCVHPDDEKFVANENKRFIEGFLLTLGANAMWVNPHKEAERADSKAFQLSVAKGQKWSIPKTLISNDPKEILEFVRTEDAIYKPFRPMVWKGADGTTRTTMTNQISVNDVNEGPDVLQSCAGIYQSRIKKAHELRVMIFGQTCMALKLNSQASAATALDWRVGFYGTLDVSPYELPGDLERACLALLGSMGLLFGVIDLAVTDTGDFVFFEINEMGQFLWCEEHCPQLPLLAAFSAFLASGDPGFVWKSTSESCSFPKLKLLPSFQHFYQARTDGHNVHLPGFFRQEQS